RGDRMRRFIIFLLAVPLTPLGAATGIAATGAPDDMSATAVTFAVIGDTPYGDAQVANFPGDVQQINDDPKVRLVIHLGDIKSGSRRCGTRYFNTVLSAFA